MASSASASASASEQLAEYESQLSDVKEMLMTDPTDPSLLKLRDDLTELIELTRG
eukprot:CAMPEP_0183298820 /NCGR_PEP_ID=MMETSP0160_2-20130417/5730_1 /TAXON_ID=2839 ORGANISM="Odontella Sinensis, Strain Grunow 1884" /NCGR_SAMPLE_ID=MMETSP0160_2 /ASSEMBLY_ACC=CAM_ASM_000250 /LENGTH=54 /DNA_ID=CAMNT_0025460937 /DNA_START=93 /DNA_END=253 /DNA_ORIENTATION=+